MENLEDSFSNPFSDYNANVLDINKILDYWCSPFAFTKSAPILESDVYKHKMPIVFMGGRGTGKTMFLRYFSYEAQRDKVLRENSNQSHNSIISHVQQIGGLGFYLRFDGPVLRSFEGKSVDPEKWDSIFTHYFELQVCKKYVEVIQDLVNREQLNRLQIEGAFVPTLANKLGKSPKDFKTIDDILYDIEDKLDEVTKFRARVAFSTIEFSPSVPFQSQDLSFGVVEIAKKTINELHQVNFVLFIDEYENYSDRQQRVVNTLMRFCQERIILRIGMRLEGFRTYATTSENEFIKENHDYSSIVFEDILIKDTDYRNFLINVAQKRLEAVPIFRNKGFTDITRILGQREDIEKEALDLIKRRENPFRHFELLKNLSRKGAFQDSYKKKLEKPDNPLLEVLNILWLLRGTSPDDVQKAMSDYLHKENTELGKKYRRDYIDKYKLSLMFVLASIYRVRKKYYSYNTFCYLSSGVVRQFIELCRRAFQFAFFEDQHSLINKGKISPELQTRAAREVANAEFEMIKRIPKYGEKLHIFALNLGNIFSEYHKDPFIRYPETNQFALSTTSITDEEIRKIFEAALEWSVIQKKPFPQQYIPGGPRADIYTLNRVFSPNFDLTYRTRGGHSEETNEPRLKQLINELNVRPIMSLGRQPKTRPDTKVEDVFQPRLDLGNGD